MVKKIKEKYNIPIIMKTEEENMELLIESINYGVKYFSTKNE